LSGDTVALTVVETHEAAAASSGYLDVYRSAHLGIYRQRTGFMTPPSHAQDVLWRTDSITVPSIAECVRRVVLLQECGPGDEAFTFARQRDPHAS
jgi:hypothetical protein